jgi:serine/threonine protein kinase
MTRTIDAFVLRERIHRGGMGIVWCEGQDALAREIPVHLVEPDPAALPALLRQIRQDARLAANHNAAAVIEPINGTPLIAMERVEGITLARLLRIGGPIELDRALDLVSQLLGALAALHDGGNVHADLQPGCVMLDMRADGERVSLVDFGGKNDASGTVATEYLAPEVIAGGTPSVAADIYAVGVILYQLLTGSLPFRGKTPVEVMQRQLHGVFAPVGLGRPDLERLCLEAMARPSSGRFRDARAFAAAVDRARAPAPVRAAGPVH